MPPQRQAVALSALLVALTLAAYWPALHAGFIWDDDVNLTANPALRSLAGLGQIWFTPRGTYQYYPLTFTSFWLEYHLWGLQPFGYHLVNILLHAMNALLVWQILRALRVPGAWLAAAVFALHPMQVESVAWVTERKNVLSGLLYLAALLAYLRATAVAPGATPARLRRLSYLAACGLFVAALLTKTVTCTLPAVLLLLVWWQRGPAAGDFSRDRSPLRGLDWRELRRLLPLFAVGVSMAALTVWLERYHAGAEGDEWALSLAGRVLVAGRAWWFYVGTVLWPHPLSFIYPRWSIDTHLWWQYLYPAAVLAVMALLYIARRRIGAGPLVATLCYTTMLAPALGFFNVYFMRYSFVADHYGYLPSIALIALALAPAADFIQRLGHAGRSVGYAAGALVLLGLAGLTARQCGIYQDLRALWADTLEKNPACWLAHNQLGLILWESGNSQDAITHWMQAIKWNPLDVEAHFNLGAALQAQNKLPEAIAQYTEALRLQPMYDDARHNLNLALKAQGPKDEVVEHDAGSAPANPGSAEAYCQQGNALLARGQLAAAAAQFAEALRLQPTYAEAHNSLGVTLARQGEMDAAVEQFMHALHWNPEYPEAHSNLGNALRAQGKLDDAVAEYREALRLRPSADTHNNLGLALAAQGKTAEARQHLEQAGHRSEAR